MAGRVLALASLDQITAYPISLLYNLWRIANPRITSVDIPYCELFVQSTGVHISKVLLQQYTQVNNLKRAPAAMTRQILSTVAKKSNSTEHFVNLNADYSVKSWIPLAN